MRAVPLAYSLIKLTDETKHIKTCNNRYGRVIHAGAEPRSFSSYTTDGVMSHFVPERRFVFHFSFNLSLINVRG